MIDFRNRDKLNGKCMNCKDKMVCRGCRAYVYAMAGVSRKPLYIYVHCLPLLTKSIK